MAYVVYGLTQTQEQYKKGNNLILSYAKGKRQDNMISYFTTFYGVNPLA